MMHLRLAAITGVLLLAGCAGSDVLEEPAELVDFEHKAEFESAWEFELSDEGEDMLLGLRPASDGSRIYVADYAGTVAAIDLESGEEAWRVETGDNSFFSDDSGLPFSAGPSVGEGYVAVGSDDGDILVLNASDGSEVWRKRISTDLLTAPVIADGKLLFRTGDGALQAFDLDTGNALWESVRELPLLTLRGQSRPAVEDENVYVAWDNGDVAALAVANGSTIWETSIGQAVGTSEVQEIADIDGDIVVFGAEVYVAGHNTNLAALAIESGEILWREEMSSVTGPAVSYGSVIATDIDSVIHAFDRLSGTSLWSQEAVRARYLTGPTLWKEYVAVGDFEGYVHLFDRTSGEMVARFSTDGEPINARPIVVGDLLIVLSADGELSAWREVQED